MQRIHGSKLLQYLKIKNINNNENILVSNIYIASYQINSVCFVSFYFYSNLVEILKHKIMPIQPEDPIGGKKLPEVQIEEPNTEDEQ